MRKLILPLLLIPVILLSAFKLKPESGGDDLVSRIATQLQKLYTLLPQESLYLHHDKSLYSLGETIWFKAYAPHNINDTLSTIIYVDLARHDNKVLFKRTLKLKSGLAHGDFFLPDTLSEGMYKIRAYTSRMRNQGDHTFFTRELNITNTSLSEPKTSISFRNKALPEGDSLTATIQFYNHPYEPLKNFKIKTYLVLDGRKEKATRASTNNDGKVHMPFYFNKTEAYAIKDALLVIQSDDKTNSFKRSYRLPLGQSILDLQFFPEGGDLVAGITSRVAFKAINIAGKGQQITGAVYDKQNNKILSFESEHLGMGSFKLRPDAEQIYTARVQLEDGTTAVYQLPVPKAEGSVLQISQYNKQTINFSIENNFNSTLNTEPLYLVAHAADSIIFALKANTENRVLESAIPASRFPAGIVYFTLFNSRGTPLNERLVFINNPPQLNLSIKTDRRVYGKRQKVTMNIDATDENGKPVSGNFSLVVRDAFNTLNEQPYTNNIYSQLYLLSNLKGHIEQPAYYFDKSQSKARQHLDLLLLTQGWRRYNWPEILIDKFPDTPHLPENSISFSGRVEKEIGKKTAQNSNLTVIFKPNSVTDTIAAIPTLVTTKTNSDGRFRFVGLDFEDTMQVFIQARTLKGSSNQIIYRNITPSPISAFYTYEDSSISSEMLAAYRNRMNDWSKADRQYRLAAGTIQLKQVEITGKKHEFSSDNRIYLKENIDARIELTKSKFTYSNVLDYLVGRVAGVQVIGSGSQNTVLIRGARPMFLLDGMRVDLETVNNLPPDDIEAIEILKGNNAVIFGVSGGGGVVALYSKRGNPNYNYANEKALGTLSFKLPGYSKPTTFYVPRYDVPEERHNLPDLRSTLHWQPNVTTDNRGKAVITFFTSDVSTDFIAVCEGLSNQGIVGTTSYKFSSTGK